MGFGIWQLLVIIALVCAIVAFRMLRTRRQADDGGTPGRAATGEKRAGR